MRPIRQPLICVAAAGLFACGGSSLHADTANASASHDAANASASHDRDSAPACPATFAEARGGCESGPDTSDCSYPEGECYCGEDPVCSGAMRRPMPPEAYTWQCTPTPPEVREDGCPGMAPDEGSACTLDHSCGYGFCGGPTYDCVDGAWHVADMGSPPP